MRRSGILDNSSNRQVKGVIDELPPDHLGRTIPDLEAATARVDAIRNGALPWTPPELHLARDPAECDGGRRMLPPVHCLRTDAWPTVAFPPEYPLHAAAV